MANKSMRLSKKRVGDNLIPAAHQHEWSWSQIIPRQLVNNDMQLSICKIQLHNPGGRPYGGSSVCYARLCRYRKELSLSLQTEFRDGCWLCLLNIVRKTDKRETGNVRIPTGVRPARLATQGGTCQL